MDMGLLHREMEVAVPPSTRMGELATNVSSALEKWSQVRRAPSAIAARAALEPRSTKLRFPSIWEGSSQEAGAFSLPTTVQRLQSI